MHRTPLLTSTQQICRREIDRDTRLGERSTGTGEVLWPTVSEKLADGLNAELREVLVPLLKEIEWLSERLMECDERMEKIAKFSEITTWPQEIWGERTTEGHQRDGDRFKGMPQGPSQLRKLPSPSNPKPDATLRRAPGEYTCFIAFPKPCPCSTV